MSDVDTRIKCVVTDDILHPCVALDRAIDGDYMSKRKGVTLMELHDFATDGFKIKRSGVVLRSGDLGKNGVLMNFCPFCGAPIAEQFHTKENT
jgi:hypothetical protein